MDYLRRAWVDVLQPLVLRDDDRARTAASRFAAIPSDEVWKCHLSPRLAAASLAILDSNAAKLSSALNAILKHHTSFRKHPLYRNRPELLLCIRAACLAILARRAGLSVEVQDQCTG